MRSNMSETVLRSINLTIIRMVLILILTSWFSHVERNALGQSIATLVIPYIISQDEPPNYFIIVDFSSIVLQLEYRNAFG